MFSTNTDIAVYRAAMVTSPSAMVIAKTPTMTGSAAVGREGITRPPVPGALAGRRERVEHRLELRAGPADGTVHDDPYIIGERGRERVLEELRRATRLGRLAGAPPEREDLLDTAGPRREQRKQSRPRREHPAAPADDGGRG